MDTKEIQNLIKFVARSGVSEVKLEMEGIKIMIRTDSISKKDTATMVQQIPVETTPMSFSTTPSVATPEIHTPTKEVEVAKEEDKYITIKSPMIGTFYRKPAPDKPSFVEIGQSVNEGEVLCVIEAMKLFNEIESEVSGKIVKILVEDSSPIEFEQPLFLIDPSSTPTDTN